MIPIGSFAHLTGLSAKALRHYHDRGLLVPAHVDPGIGYRTYAVAQVEDAIRIAALRRAELPLERIAQVLVEPDRAGDLLAAYRERLAANRIRVDRALDQAERALRGGGFVRERRTPGAAVRGRRGLGAGAGVGGPGPRPGRPGGRCGGRRPARARRPRRGGAGTVLDRAAVRRGTGRRRALAGRCVRAGTARPTADRHPSGVHGAGRPRRGARGAG